MADTLAENPASTPVVADVASARPKAAAWTKTRAEKRLEQEHRNTRPDGNNPLPEGIVACPNDDNLLHWTATIKGPPDTPYELGLFKVELKYPDDYPFRPPEVHFLTEVYHPNITMMGKICLDILAERWSPSYTIATVLQQLQGLLASPNPDDPLVREPAVTMKQDVELFRKMAREMTLKYAAPGRKDAVPAQESDPKDVIVPSRRTIRAQTAPAAVDLQTMIETAIALHDATNVPESGQQVYNASARATYHSVT